MRWLFGENPDIHTLGNHLPAGNWKLSIVHVLPERNDSIGEEEEMGLRRKQILMKQKASFEHELKVRLSFLSGKGIKSPKADKDPLVRKLQADIKAANKRLRLIAANEKRTEEMAKIKAERAAAPKKEEGGKGEKPKKATEEGKGKKIKKAPEGGKSQKTPESPHEGKATMKKAGEEAREEPAGQGKADK
jgi:hypothetical protein